MLLAVLVLVLLALACAALLCRRDSPVWPVAVILLSAAWLLVDKPLEGPVLAVISHGHGITLSDLLAPAGVAFAAVLLYRRGRARPRARGPETPRQETYNLPE